MFNAKLLQLVVVFEATESWFICQTCLRSLRSMRRMV